MDATVALAVLATVSAGRRTIEKGAMPEGAPLLYVSVKMRSGVTEATGNVASPEYVALPGSGNFSDVAVFDAAGRIRLVALNAVSEGNTGEAGVAVGKVAAGCGESTVEPPQPATNNDELIVARAR